MPQPSQAPIARTIGGLWEFSTARVVDLAGFALSPLAQTCTNPGVNITRAEAKRDLERMKRDRRDLQRPVVLLNGYHAWAGVICSPRDLLRDCTSRKADDFLAISYGLHTDFDRLRETVLKKVRERFGESQPLDVVGYSMGGILGRVCASGDDGMRIERLFTLASPHRGAKLADRITIDSAGTLDHHAGRSADSESHPQSTAAKSGPSFIRCYTQTNDPVVGATRASPPGVHPVWVGGTKLLSHFSTLHNPVLLADLARHLRGEAPLLPDAAASAATRD